MQSVIAQLADFPWFVDRVDRAHIDALLRAPCVPRDAFVVRPCATQRALAISYKSSRGDVVHTRVRLEGGEWRVDQTARRFATVNRLVQSLRLQPLARPLPVRVQVDVPDDAEPRSVFVDHRWTAGDLRAHLIAHYVPHVPVARRAALRLAERGADGQHVPLADDARFELEELPLSHFVLAPRAQYAQLPEKKRESPVYDRIPALETPSASAGSVASALGSVTGADAAVPASKSTRAPRPPLPDKAGVDLLLADQPPRKQAPRRDSVLAKPISAPRESEDDLPSDINTDSDRSDIVRADSNERKNMSPAEAAALARERASSRLVARQAQEQAQEQAHEQAQDDSAGAPGETSDSERLRVVSGRFFDDLLNDLDELEFEEAASKRESGRFSAVAGFDALGKEFFEQELEIDERTIATKKLQTMFDLIDDEEEVLNE